MLLVSNIECKKSPLNSPSKKCDLKYTLRMTTTWVHRISNVDPDLKLADCTSCGRVRVKRTNKSDKQGNTRYRCTTPIKEQKKRYYEKNGYQRYKQRWRKYGKYKKDHCESCGFVAVHNCQLDVDHIDGNHSNNSLDNLQTLCANCHRLKTYQNKDWENKSPLAQLTDKGQPIFE
jgi:predicted RNA-binding Zn-ribbon protein involved in translation (DUF1610 family)